MRPLLQHSAPFLIITAAAGLAAVSAQSAVTFASLAASSSGVAPVALQDARWLINLLWVAFTLPPVMALWSYYRAQSLTRFSLASSGALVVLVILGIYRTVGFETDLLLTGLGAKL